MKYMCKSCKTVCNDITEHIIKVHKFSEYIMKLQLKTNPNTYKNCFEKIKQVSMYKMVRLFVGLAVLHGRELIITQC